MQMSGVSDVLHSSRHFPCNESQIRLISENQLNGLNLRGRVSWLCFIFENLEIEIAILLVGETLNNFVKIESTQELSQITFPFILIQFHPPSADIKSGGCGGDCGHRSDSGRQAGDEQQGDELEICKYGREDDTEDDERLLERRARLVKDEIFGGR
jgi:hypothetical protein